MPFDLEILEEAKFEIEEAFHFYESKQLGLGVYFLENLYERFNSISTDPLKYKIKRSPFREALLSKFPHLVIFEVFDEKILVYSVFHTSRNPIKKPKK
ncbi:type II toxin-antitoxin system RelE/ParE family toxin [Algoriphagus sp. AK58]|uniref:type II toxin-antitoxin system RelE/ParE family toxin n=1 Tax=Algoriphagus sp. AK58 TaxID=1406877 RepID=UPI00351C61BD|nr:plasmid stabilization system [Algoriphagus sp. AK58]